MINMSKNTDKCQIGGENEKDQPIFNPVVVGACNYMEYRYARGKGKFKP